MLSLQEIVKRVYDNLSVDTDSTTYWLNTRVIPKINSVYQRVLRDRKFDVLINDSTYHPFIKGWDLHFLRRTFMFERKPTIIASQKSEIDDIYVYINPAAKIDDKWYCLIRWQVFAYNKIVDWQKAFLKLDERLQLPVKPGDEIEILYRIPADAEDTYQLFTIADNHEIEVNYSDYRYQEDFPTYWTILFKWDIKLIRIKAVAARYTSIFKLNYYRTAPKLQQLTDESILPDERWDTDIIALLTAGELLRETEKSDDATVKLNEWYWNLVLFYDKYATTNKWYRNDLWWNRNLQHNVPII